MIWVEIRGWRWSNGAFYNIWGNWNGINKSSRDLNIGVGWGWWWKTVLVNVLDCGSVAKLVCDVGHDLNWRGKKERNMLIEKESLIQCNMQIKFWKDL
jgi:hypothetical protein